ncbi:hypothetical protein AB1Y20_021899 [Prymnesium parvum]|uniref:ShK domain-containing protein n=1 Tax=Prymnesium parvum TaxID=97485 RepID=A0AB34JFN9_PRYPA
MRALLLLLAAHAARAQSCADGSGRCPIKAERNPHKCSKPNFRARCPVTCRACDTLPCENRKPNKCDRFSGSRLLFKCTKPGFANKCRLKCGVCSLESPPPPAPVHSNQCACDYYRDGASSATESMCFKEEVVGLIVFGCDDSLAANYNSQANTDDGECDYPGCTDSLALNYDPIAQREDFFCTYAGGVTSLTSDKQGVTTKSESGLPTKSESASFSTTNNVNVIAGCTVRTHPNYNKDATKYLHGSCDGVDAGFGCTRKKSTNYDSTAVVEPRYHCLYNIGGCPDSTSPFYNSNANSDSGACFRLKVGCTSRKFLEFDSTATATLSSTRCTKIIRGCCQLRLDCNDR